MVPSVNREPRRVQLVRGRLIDSSRNETALRRPSRREAGKSFDGTSPTGRKARKNSRLILPMLSPRRLPRRNFVRQRELKKVVIGD